ncbi:MAG: hypothetical protein U1E09_11235 [Methylococcales bacterium]|nr:hypothetical protein [Methylicorpusculum sp.]MDZ4150798.1 hypothetical protein [Methylicorpusculum sp.]MDZ4157114.1 hypothetical protein [Methylococcales bacterium]
MSVAEVIKDMQSNDEFIPEPLSEKYYNGEAVNLESVFRLKYITP